MIVDTPEEQYRIAVPYNEQYTIQNLLSVGKYDRASPAINDRVFYTLRTHIENVVVRLISLGEDSLSTKEIILNMEAQRLRPANIVELLSLGAQYPYLQMEFAIVALGTPIRSSLGSRMPCLSRVRRRRIIALTGGIPFKWRGLWRFAAVLSGA